MAGCTDTPSDPGFDAMPPEEDVEIEMATDPDLTAALIEDVSSSMTAHMTAAASVEISTAQSLFSQARVELTRSNYAQVRALGNQARDALGRALSRGRDRSSLDDYIARARDVHRRLTDGDTDDFDCPDELRRHLDRLLGETDAALSRGDHATAGRRAVDAHERTDRSRARRHDVDPEKGARLVVAMAAQAVELANRLLNDTEIDERTQHLLDTAARLATASAEAFQNHQFRRAIMLGHKAVSVSLMAVIRPDKVTDKGFGALIDLARAQLPAAEAKLALDPNEELQKLLDRAVEALESGLEPQLISGRTGPDPLVQSVPGGQGGLAIGRRLVRFGPSKVTRVVAIGAMSGGELSGGATALFRVEDVDAQSVGVLGDFSGWEPQAMTRDGRDWVLEIPLATGTYHFGFLVDDVWFVPEGAPGQVSDDWGQMNATIVVP